MGNTLDFWGHLVSVAAIHLCHYSTETSTDNRSKNGCGCGPVSFIYKNKWQVGFGLLAIVMSIVYSQQNNNLSPDFGTANFHDVNTTTIVNFMLAI